MPPRGEPVQKATVFVTRARPDGSTELLLLRHVGIQLPAGTLEPGETPLEGARREAAEETGLGNLDLVAELGAADDVFDSDAGIMAVTAAVHMRPRANSPTWATLRHGLRVDLLRQTEAWLQVEYREWDADGYVNTCIRGWVPDEAVTLRQIRHYFHFTTTSPTPDRWPVHDEGWEYVAAWYPLHDLPPIIPPQDRWLRHFPPAQARDTI